jgi:4-hydroxy-2-oxoheptanedioate aldolase
MASDFARRLRSRQAIIGYWMSSDNAPMTERLAGAGYDYICLDQQHGLLDNAASLRGLIALDAGAAAAGTATVGVVRVGVNQAGPIGRALDAGAAGVIVPLVNTPDEAQLAANACRYPPLGSRSYGPTRSSLRFGPDPTVVNDSVACIVMIETEDGLRNVQAISAVPGIDAVYIGPSDLALGIGGLSPADGWAKPEFPAALARVRNAAEAAGIACGLHCVSGEAGANALAQGFTFVSISNDLTHLDALARRELALARQASVHTGS